MTLYDSVVPFRYVCLREHGKKEQNKQNCKKIKPGSEMQRIKKNVVCMCT